MDNSPKNIKRILISLLFDKLADIRATQEKIMEISLLLVERSGPFYCLLNTQGLFFTQVSSHCIMPPWRPLHALRKSKRPWCAVARQVLVKVSPPPPWYWYHLTRLGGFVLWIIHGADGRQTALFVPFL